MLAMALGALFGLCVIVGALAKAPGREFEGVGAVEDYRI